MKMATYEKSYYSYQTRARGLLDLESLTRQFNKLSKWYGARLKAYLPDDLAAKCLDLPCGYGNFLYFLKSRGYENTIGYDFDEKQVALAKLLDLKAYEGDAFNILSDKPEGYNLISSLDFIEHLSKDDALRFIELCYQQLQIGGVLILRTPCADGPFGAHDAWNDLTHQWGMTSNVIRTMLEMSGFENVDTLDERPQPTSLIDFVRWLVFFPTKACASAVCMALGMRPPMIWSRSMIVVGYKPRSVD